MKLSLTRAKTHAHFKTFVRIGARTDDSNGKRRYPITDRGHIDALQHLSRADG